MHTESSAASYTLRTLERQEVVRDGGLAAEGDYVYVLTEQDEGGWVYRPYLHERAFPVPDLGPGAAVFPGDDGHLAVHFIDVGQGDSTLIVCPNGDRILVDAGAMPYPQPATVNRIRNLIHSLLDPDESQIDVVVVTHPDGDHYGLLPATLRGIEFSRLLRVSSLSSYRDTGWDGTRHNGRRWLAAVEAAGKSTTLSRNHHDAPDEPSQYFDCGAADVFIIAAAVEETDVPSRFRARSESNSRSIVLLVRHGDFEVILTGDATRATEYQIMRWYQDEFLDVDVLKIGHHGSVATSTHQDWADVTRPQAAITSSGYTNRYGHPHYDVVERLEPYTIDDDPPHSMRWYTGRGNQRRRVDQSDYSEAIYSTATNGTVSVYTDGSEWWLETTASSDD